MIDYIAEMHEIRLDNDYDFKVKSSRYMDTKTCKK